MTHCVTTIMIMDIELKQLRTISASSPTMATAIPNTKEHKIKPSMFDPSSQTSSLSNFLQEDTNNIL
jgi:hypothetical protein